MRALACHENFFQSRWHNMARIGTSRASILPPRVKHDEYLLTVFFRSDFIQRVNFDIPKIKLAQPLLHRARESRRASAEALPERKTKMKCRKRRNYHRSPQAPPTVYVAATPPGARRLARPNEACVYGKFSKRTLYRLINKKIIKAYRYSSRLTMIDLDSIDAFQASLTELNHAHG
jgi:hypothetical protein